VHVIVFFIFLVANIGGSLTPLGDPPLFLGFLKGVHFFWPTTHMFLPMIIISSILLGMFFLLDSYLYKKEGTPPVIEAADKKVGLEGKVNILLLLGVVACVLMSGIWKPGISIDVYHVPVELQNIVRDVLLLVIAGLSLLLTNSDSRKANAFTWFPIVEVAKLFIGIFLTIIPAIAILKAGADGALSGVVHAVTAPDGEPINYMYFWLTGILSSFLDNAPTYLVFFNTAGGDAAHLMAEAVTLLAISCGAVFMGAMTYVGNAPNFMVRAIAEERGIAMPSFFGYMMWSGAFLFPLFGLVTLLFFI
jgi:Na+/H+ antiporter NhaD/arsenite permease-like protein